MSPRISRFMFSIAYLTYIGTQRIKPIHWENDYNNKDIESEIYTFYRIGILNTLTILAFILFIYTLYLTF